MLIANTKAIAEIKLNSDEMRNLIPNFFRISQEKTMVYLLQ